MQLSFPSFEMPAPKPRATGGRSPKARGARYELELAAWFQGSLNLPATRLLVTQDLLNKGQGMSDLAGVPHLAVEAKRVESLQLRSAWTQAQRNAADNEIPVVITRRNQQPTAESLCVLTLKDFTMLYEAWLQGMSDEFESPDPPTE